ncbi:hypothetical protein FA95DRAFT_1566086 [Auriscalpium vulgare]|uniref:Uncharacterized protein n=1 Tax=Auriscalpium vulgare TaxID=40419 RepID=A0ACB8R9Q6_9AGAM|nr:hypothetical protein FA95DRAFT_1566086 [Auriscalpium vulgare]
MQPVPCWEKVWVEAAPGTTLKVYKWVKTDKVQHFSDDEGGVDEPLVPLPDEPEVVEGDEDMDQDEPAASVPPASRDISEPILAPSELPSKAPTPKPHPLSMSFQASSLEDETQEEVTLQVPDNIDTGLDVRSALNPDGLDDLDMSQLGPDGTAFESAGDLTQMEATDALLGGEMMDDSLAEDPFALPET